MCCSFELVVAVAGVDEIFLELEVQLVYVVLLELGVCKCSLM